MKKVLLLFVFCLALFGGYLDDVRAYLLQKEFKVNGKFFISNGKWLFGLNDDYGHVSGFYELLGTTPTPQNPFGWKIVDQSIDLLRAREAGWFVKIDFPPDFKDPATRDYSWIYIDKQTSKIYKLMGSKNGQFVYYDDNNDSIPDPIPQLHFSIKGDKIVFFGCKKSYAFRDGSLKVEKLFKSTGNIEYGCDETWRSQKELRIENLSTYEKIRGTIEGNSFIGTIFKDFARGRVVLEGMMNGKYVACFQSYTPPKLEEIKNAAALKALVGRWGYGSGPRDGFITQNCNFPDLSIKRFALDIEKYITIQETNQTSDITIYKTIIKR